MIKVLCDSEMDEIDKKVMVKEDGIQFMEREGKEDQEKITK